MAASEYDQYSGQQVPPGAVFYCKPGRIIMVEYYTDRTVKPVCHAVLSYKLLCSGLRVNKEREFPCFSVWSTTRLACGYEVGLPGQDVNIRRARKGTILPKPPFGIIWVFRTGVASVFNKLRESISGSKYRPC